MNQIRDMETETNRKNSLSLQAFCDMNQLYRLLDNWSKSCGMATVIVDTEGNQVSEDFGITEFCRMVQSCEKGKACCLATWKADLDGIYECPFGFWDFSNPIVLPDGQVLGKVLAGQAMSVKQKEEEILQKVAELGIDEKTVRAVLSRVQRKTEKEMQGAYELLKETLYFYVQNSYSIWKTNNELKKEPAKKDRVLSQITQIMYSYNLTVDLETESYILITGTGMERTVAEYKKHNDYRELRAFQGSVIHPAYINRFNELTNFESARNNPSENGYRESLEYPVLYPGDVEYEWHEINVFIDTEEDGRRVANILGRDITEAHNAQEKSEKELRAAAAKNQILSELTKLLYSYNLTLNLRTGKYSMIIGTGMTQFMEIFKSTDDYETAYNKKISYLDPENVSQFAALASLEALRARTNANGFIGNLEYGAFTDYGEEWHEINVFISTDEAGEPVANILGRDITEAHKRQEQRENQQKAAMARDQLLSGVTKMLYGYNITVNLETWKYSLITGTGMERILEIMQHNDDYVLVHAKLLQGIASEDKEEFENLVGIAALRERSNATGFVGTISCRVPVGEFDEWHEVNLFMGTNEDGVPVANILGRDISEAHEQQEAKERELKASAAKDQILSDITKTLYSYNATVNLNTGKYSLIIGTGMEEIIQYFSRTDDYEKACEYLLEKALPEYPEEMNRRFSLQALRQQQNLSGHIGQIEYAAVTEKGIGWFEVNAFMGVDEEGNPTANILGRDVTEIHEAQERRENELKAVAAKDQILSNITKTLYSYNLTLNLESGKYSLIVGTGMKDFVKIFEFTDDYEAAYRQKIQYVTEDCMEAFGNFSSLTALRNRKNENGYIGNLEYSVKTDKGIEWHEINIFLGTDENGEPIANILGRDVTEAHDKADTKAQLEIANASSAAKSAFLFNMSHDIRTPMNAIIGFTELLEKHLDDKELALSYIKKIQTSNDFLLSLINNVLEMARIESGKTTLDETYWDAYAFNDTLFSLFASQMKEKGIEFTRTNKIEHPYVICDETKLREIFLNILSNALKYTPSGGKVSMNLTEIPSDMPGYAMYQTVIEDTGIGMSEEFLPHLFEEFTRERSSTESKLNGTGLGMPIVKKLVDLMQGTIEVESKVGRGTKITVTLPHRIAQEADTNRFIEKAQGYDEDFFKGKRILLAEDNELNAEIAITILEEAGFGVEHAADGIICVDMMEKAEAGYYDLILMDIQMPNMDGYKATQIIRKLSNPQKAGITIVAMTANAFDEDKRNAYMAGMNWHIAKPIKVDELMSALTEILKE
ncbi:MAG: PocR ligand-binding domain-containing protein [Eubacteriales bacterium]|nr:PocR ligand-binding domain-containing protein [Eubacteriales bacterium]